MKDEIKEKMTIGKAKKILRDFLVAVKEDCYIETPLYYAIPYLLDYITNLQEENEYSDYCNKKLREKITNLEYKITTLEDYKTRNKKAIEHIGKHQLIYTSQYEEESNFDNHLLEILQGKSDE